MKDIARVMLPIQFWPKFIQGKNFIWDKMVLRCSKENQIFKTKLLEKQYYGSSRWKVVVENESLLHFS